MIDVEVEGHKFKLREPTAREVVDVLRGATDPAGQLELIAAACVEHDLGGDLLDAPLGLVLAVGQAWLVAAQETALPPATGRR